jgi:hypothetical protein
MQIDQTPVDICSGKVRVKTNEVGKIFKGFLKLTPISISTPAPFICFPIVRFDLDGFGKGFYGSIVRSCVKESLTNPKISLRFFYLDLL